MNSAANTMSFDSAAQTARKILTRREASALIRVAVEMANDSRSAADLATEFGVPVAVVEGLQG
jgi:hypothetical protein